MKIHQILMFGAVVLSMAFSPAKALPDCLLRLENGHIDWATGLVTATGHSAPEINAERQAAPMPGSARVGATRNLIALLTQMKITEDITVGEYALTHDAILVGIEKIAQDARICRQLYTSALDVEVWIQTPIYGGFLQLVLPDHIRQIPRISEQVRQGEAGPLKNTPTAVSGTGPYTGLIVDARKLKLSPVLYPTIVSEKGRAIYSSVFVSRDFAVQNGVCAYLCDMDQALGSARAGSNPLVVKALRKTRDKTGAIVMSMADAEKLERATERHMFFRECRVIIVINQPVR